MKRTLVIGILMVLFTFLSNAQGKYSKERLEQLSQDQLDSYFQKAQKLKKTGTAVTLIGATPLLLGIALLSMNKEVTAYVGLGMATIGLGVTVIGIPILITGASRVKRINGMKHSVSDGIFLEVAPCSFKNHLAQNYQSGATLRIRF